MDTRQFDAERLHRVQQLDGQRHVVHEQAFGQLDDQSLRRQLGGRERETFTRSRFVHTVDLEHDAARAYFGDESHKISLTLSHFYFGWLLSKWSIRKDTNPHATCLADCS